MNQSPQNNTFEFILSEIAHAENERIRLKNEAVQRLNFFLTLTSALLGGAVVLSQVAPINQIGYIVMSILIFLCIIGWQNFQFMIERDINTDRVIRTIARLRRYFTDDDPQIHKYLTWQDHDEPTKYIVKNSSSTRQAMEAVVAFLLAFLLGIFVSIYGSALSSSVVSGFVVFLVFLVFEEFYAHRQFKLAVEKANSEKRFPRVDRSKQIL